MTTEEWDFIETQVIVLSMFDNSCPFPFVEHLLERPIDAKKVMDFDYWDDYHRDFAGVLSFLHHLDLAFVSGKQETIESIYEHSREIEGILVVIRGGEGCAAVPKGALTSIAARTVLCVVGTTSCRVALQAAVTVSYLRTETFLKH